MNYYKPRKMIKTGLYHFTCMNDGQIWLVGYCADACLGHKTPEEAAAHHHEWLLDNRLSFETSSSAHRCRVCDKWTTGYALMDTQLFHLCNEHRSRDVVADLTEPAMMIVSSW